MTSNKEFVAASATPLVLSILRQNDSYGYAIIRQVEQLSAGEMTWADGMLYPILHRLEKRGQIESYWGTAETGRRRKYYRLKPAGLAALKDHRSRLDALQQMLKQLDQFSHA